MKILKNESTSYLEQIFAALTNCYRKNAEPTNAALMNLYSFTGRCILEQGEKAFVVYLAEQLAQRFSLLKGFSPRNLRRMRDFYRTYQNSPSLMAKALMLGWTQNTVILECCDTDSQRSFYLGLAAEQSLSKIALTKAIETNAFEAAQNAEVAQQNTTKPCAAVYQIAPDKTADTAKAAETACGAFVPACEPSHQGDGATIEVLGGLQDNLPPNQDSFFIGCLVKSKLLEIMSKTSPSGTSPPRATVFQWVLFMCHAGITEWKICRKKFASIGSHLRLMQRFPS